MNDLQAKLASVLADRNLTQTELSLLTGVSQPRLSAYVNGRVGLSLDMFTYLMSSLGQRVTVTVETAPADLNRSDRHSWQLHRAVAMKMDSVSLDAWRPRIASNIIRLRNTVQGEPHEHNLVRWENLVREGDVRALKRVMLDIGPDGIAMRNVSPFTGALTQEERIAALEGRIP